MVVNSIDISHITNDKGDNGPQYGMMNVTDAGIMNGTNGTKSFFH